MLALVLGVMGLLAGFAPGSGVRWFGIAAGMAAFGLISPKWRLRAWAAMLAAALGFAAYAEYQSDLRYHEWRSGHK
jgi:hypothetical protein